MICLRSFVRASILRKSVSNRNVNNGIVLWISGEVLVRWKQQVPFGKVRDF